MKKLEFTEANAEAYDMLYETTRVHPVKGLDEILKAATIVEKLKEFGTEKGEKAGDFQPMKLKVIPTTLELEDDHFKYIKTGFESVPFATSVNIEKLAMVAKFLKSVETG